MSAESQADFPEKHGYLVGYGKPPERTKWKAGDPSPNPGGVKKGQVFVSECYKRLILLSPEELKTYKPVNVAEQIALRQVKDALGQSKKVEALPAVKEITDRTEGKARQSVDVNATTINVSVQIQLFVDAATELATRHGVPLELAQARMLALADPAQRAAIEAALAEIPAP